MDNKNKSQEYKELLKEKGFGEIIHKFKQDYNKMFIKLLDRKKIEYDEDDNKFEILSLLVMESYPELEPYISYIRGILVEEGIEGISIVEDMLDTYLNIQRKYKL